MSPPVPGSAPITTPMVEVCSDSGRCFFTVLSEGTMRLIFWRTASLLTWCSCISASETPNMPIITAIKLIPPCISGRSKVKRSVKVSGSRPTAPMAMPSAPAKMPLIRLPEDSEPTRRMPRTASSM